MLHPLMKALLCVMDQLKQSRCQPVGENLGNDLANNMNQGNGPVISHPNNFRQFRQQRQQGFIHLVEIAHVKMPKGIEHFHQIQPDDLPCCL
jgi:hypothetical protein